MNQRTQAFLMCISPAEERGERLAFCGGELIQRDPLTLLCTRCRTEYPIKSGIPQLLPKEADESNYLTDEVIQEYYEMHYGPFISSSQMGPRLSFPQPNLVQSSRKDPPVESFADVRRQRRALSKELQLSYESLAHLVGSPHPTEDFYQYILEMSRPLINSNSVVLDVGCALGRMTAEIAALGVAYVIGLDRSPRMAEEAARLIGTPGSIPVNLNLVGGQTIGAHLTLNYHLENVDFLVGNAEQLPFRERTVDIALALNLIDRIPHPHRAIAEMARILKPEGFLIITDPYHWEDGAVERKYWVDDMAVFFDPSLWERKQEVDGIPFVMRVNSRRLAIYLNHCLVYRKK